MSFWLLKTEPSTYSYNDLKADRRTAWTGVRNNLALRHLRAIRRGEKGMLYHTGKEKAVIGLIEFVSDPYADPDATPPRGIAVDVRPLRRFLHPVPLTLIRGEPTLKNLPLLRITRLSVMPLSDAEWTTLLRLAGA